MNEVAKTTGGKVPRISLVVFGGAVSVLLAAAVLVPIAVRASREAARRDAAENALRQIQLALDEYVQRQVHFPLEDAGAAADDDPELPFDTYSGYFVRNDFQPKTAESFAVLTSQEDFDKVFGVASVMGDKSHRLSQGAFASCIVLAAVKRGNAVWEFKVERVGEAKGVVQLRYTAKSTKNESATFACPLIVSIPAGDYTTIEWIENGGLAKAVEIGKK